MIDSRMHAFRAIGRLAGAACLAATVGLSTASAAGSAPQSKIAEGKMYDQCSVINSRTTIGPNTTVALVETHGFREEFLNSVQANTNDHTVSVATLTSGRVFPNARVTVNDVGPRLTISDPSLTQTLEGNGDMTYHVAGSSETFRIDRKGVASQLDASGRTVRTRLQFQETEDGLVISPRGQKPVHLTPFVSRTSIWRPGTFKHLDGSPAHEAAFVNCGR